MIQTLITILALVACPLMMVWMMRGMRGTHDRPHQRTESEDVLEQHARIAALEQEVAELRRNDARRDEPARVAR